MPSLNLTDVKRRCFLKQLSYSFFTEANIHQYYQAAIASLSFHRKFVFILLILSNFLLRLLSKFFSCYKVLNVMMTILVTCYTFYTMTMKFFIRSCADNKCYCWLLVRDSSMNDKSPSTIFGKSVINSN